MTKYKSSRQYRWRRDNRVRYLLAVKLRCARLFARERGHEPCTATVAELLETITDQCAICDQSGELCLDHDHKTGAFRGWLCHDCNRAIGLLNDDPALLKSAMAYLRRHHAVS